MARSLQLAVQCPPKGGQTAHELARYGRRAGIPQIPQCYPSSAGVALDYSRVPSSMEERPRSPGPGSLSLCAGEASPGADRVIVCLAPSVRPNVLVDALSQPCGEGSALNQSGPHKGRSQPWNVLRMTTPQSGQRGQLVPSRWLC